MDQNSAFYPGSTRYGGSSAIMKRRAAARKTFFRMNDVPRQERATTQTSIYSFPVEVIRNETKSEPELSKHALNILKWINQTSATEPKIGAQRQRKLNFRFNPMGLTRPGPARAWDTTQSAIPAPIKAVTSQSSNPPALTLNEVTTSTAVSTPRPSLIPPPGTKLQFAPRPLTTPTLIPPLESKLAPKISPTKESSPTLSQPRLKLDQTKSGVNAVLQSSPKVKVPAFSVPQAPATTSSAPFLPTSTPKPPSVSLPKPVTTPTLAYTPAPAPKRALVSAPTPTPIPASASTLVSSKPPTQAATISPVKPFLSAPTPSPKLTPVPTQATCPSPALFSVQVEKEQSDEVSTPVSAPQATPIAQPVAASSPAPKIAFMPTPAPIVTISKPVDSSFVPPTSAVEKSELPAVSPTSKAISSKHESRFAKPILIAPKEKLSMPPNGRRTFKSPINTKESSNAESIPTPDPKSALPVSATNLTPVSATEPAAHLAPATNHMPIFGTITSLASSAVPAQAPATPSSTSLVTAPAVVATAVTTSVTSAATATTTSILASTATNTTLTTSAPSNVLPTMPVSVAPTPIFTSAPVSITASTPLAASIAAPAIKPASVSTSVAPTAPAPTSAPVVASATLTQQSDIDMEMDVEMDNAVAPKLAAPSPVGFFTAAATVGTTPAAQPIASPVAPPAAASPFLPITPQPVIQIPTANNNASPMNPFQPTPSTRGRKILRPVRRLNR